MPISQGSAGGHMPGLSLRAWALVTAAGVLVKGMNAASATTAAGTYTLTIQDGNASPNSIVTVRPMSVSNPANGWVTGIAGAVLTYKTQTVGGTAANTIHHIEVWE